MVLQPPSAWSGAAAALHRASGPGSLRPALPASPPCCLQICANHLASSSFGSRRHRAGIDHFRHYFRLRLGLGFMRRLDPVLPRGSHFLVTVRDTRRGIPAATLAMPIQVRHAIDLAGFRFCHTVFRCLGDGWPQQHHNSNGDNTHVRNTHDSRTCSRDKPRERPSSVNVTLPVLYAPAIVSQRGSATTKLAC